MGMDVSKFILSSAFDFMGELEFEPILTSLGVCYTWNGDGKATTKMSGSLYNLHLILDINRELYEAGLTTSTGVKVNVIKKKEERTNNSHVTACKPVSQICHIISIFDPFYN